MARQIQIIKGTTAQNEAFTGAEGVLTYDTEKKNLRIHDGTTEGGFEIPSSAMIDYVVESQEPTSGNGYTWYRLYKSGWVEQGGHVDAPVDAYLTVSLPLEMQDGKYSIVLGHSGKNAQGGFNTGYRDQTTTSFILVSPNRGTSIDNYGSWQVSGMAA